jgi:hypothetical protein
MSGFEARFASRFADQWYGGGGGGSNPASGMTKPFGEAIGTVGHGLTDWFGELKGESMRSMAQLNPYIDTMLATAFDPQKELYGRTLQQVTDQTRSAEAARGVANTPYGAAAEGQTLGNFNIDWDNAQLARQQTGLASAGNTYGQLIHGGAEAASPAEAAIAAYANAFNTASNASTADLNRQEQSREFGMQQISGLGGSLGSLVGKAGGGGG